MTTEAVLAALTGPPEALIKALTEFKSDELSWNASTGCMSIRHGLPTLDGRPISARKSKPSAMVKLCEASMTLLEAILTYKGTVRLYVSAIAHTALTHNYRLEGKRTWPIFTAFGLVSPYMILRDTFDVKWAPITLGTPARSLYAVLERLKRTEDIHLQRMSDQTLRAIVLAQYGDDDAILDAFGPKIVEDTVTRAEELDMAKVEMMKKFGSRAKLEQEVVNVVRQEIEASHIHPIRLLLCGVFFEDNWTHLSDTDFWHIAECYASPTTLKARDRTVAAKLILGVQDTLLTELIAAGCAAMVAVQGRDILTPLLSTAPRLPLPEA